MFKRGRLYYLLYSGNDWRRRVRHGLRGRRARRFGPVPQAASHSPFLRSRRGIFGPGGGSVTVTARRGGLWLAYTPRGAGAPASSRDRRRSLHLDRLTVGGGRVRIAGPVAAVERPPVAPP